MSAAETAGQAPTTWLSQRERGALLGIRFAFVLATVLGRWPARQFVRLIALFYTLFDGDVRRASRQWLSRVHGRPARWREIYQHVFTFAQVALDRIFLLRGKTTMFHVNRTGSENLRNALSTGKGALLLGAHLGSFEAIGALG